MRPLPGLLAPALGSALLLSGCGGLPRPFEGNPGLTAMRLAAPPPSRLAVPVPAASLLTDAGARAWAGEVADALQAQEVPAVAHPAAKGDWRLAMSAELRGDSVVPSFAVQNPKGVVQGTAEGAPVPAAQWQAADPAVLKQEAAAAAPGIASLLTSIEAARRQSDPNSLVNRPPRVFVSGVTGAPGDGDESLLKQIRLKLPAQGEVVQDTGAGADYALRGEVKTAPGPNGMRRVEITWIVSDAQGREAGRVAQLNDVPAGSLDRYWGDIAAVVAEQAAGGIDQVIVNQTGPRRKGAGPAAVQAAAHGPAPR